MARATHPPGPEDPTAERRAGVLLPLGSLPGGRLGREAVAFVDWLADAGQGWWHILPLSPPDPYGSPYASPSAFAAWPGYLSAPRARVGAGEAAAFRERQRYWIDDWTRFAGTGALEDQVRVEREWRSLRDHATSRGVRILGDLPFYVAPRAADVRAHPRLFRTDLIAGAAPDAYSDVGQLWGNPTYDWPAMRADGFRWWIERLRRACGQVDSLRIDHFRAFTAWWGVARGARNAGGGSWRRGPGPAVIEAARDELGALSLVAEDLGVITGPVRRLMDDLGLPGMRVLQFAFEGGAANPHRLENHPRRSVAYSGTHDNETAAGWWGRATPAVRAAVRDAARETLGDAIGNAPEDGARALVRLTLRSRAGLAIVPVQDVLGLGDEARLNTPGTRHGNWAWRLPAGALGAREAAWLREATAVVGRLT